MKPKNKPIFAFPMKTTLRTSLILLFSAIALVVAAIFAWKWATQKLLESKQVEIHSMVVQEVEKLGNLELIRYNFKDIVRFEKQIPFWPDPTLTLLAQGNVVACIDLSAIAEDNVTFAGDTVEIVLPEPFLCQVKIDHEQSRIIDSYWTFMEGPAIADEVYKRAEQQMRKAAEDSHIRQQAKDQAFTLLHPLLTRISGRPVRISFQGDNSVLPRFKTPD